MPCPPPLPGFKPRTVQSPSALRADAECRASWGRGNLEGRRLEVPAYEALGPEPKKAPKGSSAVEKKRATLAIKAYNKPMRMALGTAVHAVFEAYYLQKTPGAWHAPRPWVDLAPLWHSRPGQIALSGRAHMPAPESLAEARCEEFVSVAMVPGWPEGEPWPNLGGTPDLVTLDARDKGVGYPWAWHLYDYKTTIDFQYAKTAAELLEDEQAVLYALAVMQENGLQSLDCTWLYMKTKGAVAAIVPVHFTMPRAHAEAMALKFAKQARELEAITLEYISAPRGFLGDATRLRVLASLPTNDGHCPVYGGCAFHSKEGGPCKPKKSPLGTALMRDAKQAKKLQGRKQAAKERRESDIMLNEQQSARLAELQELKTTAEATGEKLLFKLGQELVKLTKLAGESAGTGATEPSAPASKPADVEATGEEVKPSTPAPAAAKPTGKALVVGEPICVVCGRVDFELPPNSPFHKPIMAAVKALAAAKAALAGE